MFRLFLLLQKSFVSDFTHERQHLWESGEYLLVEFQGQFRQVHVDEIQFLVGWLLELLDLRNHEEEETIHAGEPVDLVSLVDQDGVLNLLVGVVFGTLEVPYNKLLVNFLELLFDFGTCSNCLTVCHILSCNGVFEAVGEVSYHVHQVVSSLFRVDWQCLTQLSQPILQSFDFICDFLNYFGHAPSDVDHKDLAQFAGE